MVVYQEVELLIPDWICRFVHSLRLVSQAAERDLAERVRLTLKEGALARQGFAGENSKPDYVCGQNVHERHCVRAVVLGIAPIDVHDIRQDHELEKRLVNL